MMCGEGYLFLQFYKSKLFAAAQMFTIRKQVTWLPAFHPMEWCSWREWPIALCDLSRKIHKVLVMGKKSDGDSLEGSQSSSLHLPLWRVSRWRSVCNRNPPVGISHLQQCRVSKRPPCPPSMCQALATLWHWCPLELGVPCIELGDAATWIS